jgi:hypothetical protein
MTHDFPVLQPTQYTLLQVEVATGIVLTITGEWAIDVAERYLVFNSFSELETFAKAKTHAHPAIECVAFDHEHKRIKVFRNSIAV